MGTLSVDKLVKTSAGAAEFTLPATDGTAGQVWQTDGAGQLSVGAYTIPTDAVDTAQIAALAVDTAEIAANAVDGTKIAMGSDAAGDILYYNGTDYVRLPKGTAAQQLAVNSGATAPEWTTVTAATLAPAFSACTNTATTAFSSGTNQKVVLDRELFDSNGAFDSSTNYRFTVPAGEGGKYLISAGITFLWGSGAFNIQSMIFKGGVEAGSVQFVAGASWTTNQTLCGAWMLDLAATNYIELFGYITGGGTLQYNGNATAQRTWMSGFKLLGI